ncbi:phosphotransferase family protein [Arthrobacter cheniae]|nr:phosphotransferase [Arthrobacter cheniae]
MSRRNHPPINPPPNLAPAFGRVRGLHKSLHVGLPVVTLKALLPGPRFPHRTSGLTSSVFPVREHRGRDPAPCGVVEAAARQILGSYQPAPVVVVPTHGDWQPRNWLRDGNWLQVIDFGRFDLRPAATDFCRLATQQWKEIPLLEEAFLNGYGPDPRNDRVWPIDLLREAVGTAVWAFVVGDTKFEAQGHRTLEEAIARF